MLQANVNNGNMVSKLQWSKQNYVAVVTTKLHIKYVVTRVRKPLGDAVGLRMILCGKTLTKFSCIIAATSYCRYTSLYILFKRSLYWLSDGVGGGSRRNALRQSQLHTGAVKTGIMMMIPLKCWARTHKGIATVSWGLSQRPHNT